MNRKIVGIIPARGGSKGIKKKNLCPLLGKPLIQYTIESAKDSVYLSRIILSSDSKQIVDFAKKFMIEAPFRRPKTLAKDTVSMLEVVKHVLGWLKKRDNYFPEIIVLLQPTSPLRTAEHIDEAIKMLIDSRADSIVSVVKVPHKYSPISLMNIKKGRLMPFLPEAGTAVLRRQDKPQVYARNGPAVLAIRSAAFERTNSLFGASSIPYLMGWPESLDIDTPADLQLAEFFMRRQTE